MSMKSGRDRLGKYMDSVEIMITPRLCHYIYFSWYTKNRWELWARSCYPKIPFGKTNMIIESHWKVLKHNYLYRFHRPSLDYVVYVLCEKLLTAQRNRFYQLSN